MTSSSLFTAADYQRLHALVFHPDYPGNATARGIVEAPNGDSTARDTEKRYSHVACKYLQQYEPANRTDAVMLENYLYRAYNRAVTVALRFGVPEAFLPSFEHGALRVLEYPAGAGASARHTDFDLFTLNCYRNLPNPGLPATEVHMGEIGELIGLGAATSHEVITLPDTSQHSIVYFAIPDHGAMFTGGGTVGEWLKERMSRSRYAAAAETK